MINNINSHAQGWCRVGIAQLEPLPDGKSFILTCHGNGLCYETDENGSFFPGAKIDIHINGEIIEATIVSKVDFEIPSDTPKEIPTDILPSAFKVEIYNYETY